MCASSKFFSHSYFFSFRPENVEWKKANRVPLEDPDYTSINKVGGHLVLDADDRRRIPSRRTLDGKYLYRDYILDHYNSWNFILTPAEENAQPRYIRCGNLCSCEQIISIFCRVCKAPFQLQDRITGVWDGGLQCWVCLKELCSVSGGYG